MGRNPSRVSGHPKESRPHVGVTPQSNALFGGLNKTRLHANDLGMSREVALYSLLGCTRLRAYGPPLTAINEVKT